MTGRVRALLQRVVLLWQRDPKGMSIDLLRVGIGAIWALNLIFILAPSNQYFPMFQSMAGGFGATTLGGPGFANFVASYPVIFAWTIALVTVYLAVAFLTGLTTRLACVTGAVASVAFLLSQWYQTFNLTGAGTDVGAHPLYLLIYVILFTAGAGQYFALDHWFWSSGHARLPRVSRWIASPRDLPCNAACPAAGSHPAPAPISMAPATPASRSPPASPRPWRALGAIVLVLALVAVGGALAMRTAARPGGGSPAVTTANVNDVRLVIVYPGNATTGGFGAAMQDGCWRCAYAVVPGATFTEEEMLTNGPNGPSLTVTGMSAGAPFSLTSGPSFPKVVGAGQMLMFDIELQAPPTPGSYDVTLTFTVD